MERVVTRLRGSNIRVICGINCCVGRVFHQKKYTADLLMTHNIIWGPFESEPSRHVVLGVG